MYSFDVAQATKRLASSWCSEPDEIPSAQTQSQLARLPRPRSGASAKPTRSATFDVPGSVTDEAATVASIQIAHFPFWNRFSVSV